MEYPKILKVRCRSSEPGSQRVGGWRGAGQVNLLEGEDAEGPVGLVAGVVSHPLAPEVVGEDAPQAGSWSHVWVVHDGPHVVVHELPVQGAAVGERAHGQERAQTQQPGEPGEPGEPSPRPPRPPPAPGHVTLLARGTRRDNSGPASFTILWVSLPLWTDLRPAEELNTD